MDVNNNLNILMKIIDTKKSFIILEKDMYEELLLFNNEESILDYKIIRETLEMVNELFIKFKCANELYLLFYQLKDLRKSQEVVFNEHFLNNHLNELISIMKEHIERLANYGYDVVNLEFRQLLMEYADVYSDLAESLSEISE